MFSEVYGKNSAIVNLRHIDGQTSVNQFTEKQTNDYLNQILVDLSLLVSENDTIQYSHAQFGTG